VSFRATSRVLLFDGDDRVLMFLQLGKDRSAPPRWTTPGGGVDPGEDHVVAGLRELREETGLALDRLDAPFFAADFDPDQRWHVYTSGHWEWFAVRVSRFEPSRDGWTEEELADVQDWRWFAVAELADSGFAYEPAELPDLIRQGLATLEPRRGV
jgi:8-oxo-dGTP pyrophosphatase MutT (NUDIX family)